MAGGIQRDNWNNSPKKPVLDVQCGINSVTLSISNYDIDNKFFEIYRNDIFYCTTTLPTYTDNNVVADFPYEYKVRAADFAGLYGEFSDPDSGLPGKEITVRFIMDLRPSLIAGTVEEPNYGIAVTGNVKPLTSNTNDNMMKKIRNGVYELSRKMVTNSVVNFNFTINPKSQNEQLEKARYIFTYKSFTATSVTVSGSFNGWNITATPLKYLGWGIWYLSKELAAGDYKYKFVVNGVYESGDDRILTIASSRTDVVTDQGNNSMIIPIE